MPDPVVPGGCILIARKIIESEIWGKPPLYIKIWLFLLTSAQHSNYKGLQRGQLITSIPEIIEGVKWHVGARVERPTKDQVFQVLEFLRGKAIKSQRSPYESKEESKMITTTKATHKILITINKYGVYQDFNSYESNAESNDQSELKAMRKQRQPDNINKNVKNDNKRFIVEQLDQMPFKEIIDYLNQTCGTNYKPSTEETKRLIRARFKSGFTYQDFIQVINNKHAEWANGEMQKYLRPQTLFGTKFESYLNQPVSQKGNTKWDELEKELGHD